MEGERVALARVLRYLMRYLKTRIWAVQLEELAEFAGADMDGSTWQVSRMQVIALFSMCSSLFLFLMRYSE
jgi:hypothetical protein